MTHPALSLWLKLVGLFYPRVGVSFKERFPAVGPVIVVANHPNGLLDPLVLRLAIGAPFRFLGKSTFWDNPVGAWAMEAAGALPVYRAQEADTSKNEQTFARCRALLADRGYLALFPEGTTHSRPELLPLKTGAARIALSAEGEAGWKLGLRVVPVGLHFEDKAIFRSRVSVVVGEPLRVDRHRPTAELDDRAAVEQLTEEIADALGQVVLRAANDELWRGLVAVATWTAVDGGADVAARDRRALALSSRVRQIAVEDPGRLASATAQVRRFVQLLEEIGVADPLAVAAPDGPMSSRNLRLLLLIPPAVVGAALAWLPYRAVRPIAKRMAGGHADVEATYKLLIGMVVLPLTWILWTMLATWWLGLAGLWMLVLGPWTGLAALQLEERLAFRWDALRGWWWATDSRVQRAVLEQRAALCALVEDALAPARPPDPDRG